MWWRIFTRSYQRRVALRTATAGAMRDFLTAPWPVQKTSCRDVRIVALDMETTGLDPERDTILSIGLVVIHGMTIKLDSAWQVYMRSARSLPEETVVIHGITDDQSAQGHALTSVLPVILNVLSGSVLLAHHASLEQRFLDRACRAAYNAPFVLPIIDTQALARRSFERRNEPIKSGDLRLFNLRTRYHLPRYQAHHALSDALATAELFLAMAAEISPDGACRLKDVLTG